MHGSADLAPVPQVWRRVSKEVLSPQQPFAVHQLLFSHVYARWNAAVEVRWG